MSQTTKSTSRPRQLRDLLSTERLTPYLAATPTGSWPDALRLYDWNVKVSAAFYEDLHYLEVGMRNAMDLALSDYAQQLGVSASWYTTSLIRLNEVSRDAIKRARTRATSQNAIPEVHGKVVAELNFGFWWSLLSQGYNRTLWAPCLKDAFDGPIRRQRLHSALNEMRKLRNRIAHHEPLHTRTLYQDHKNLLNTAGKIAIQLRSHLETVTRVPAVLATKP